MRRHGEVVDLDSVELVKRDANGDVQHAEERRLVAVLVLNDTVLDRAQLAVRLCEEVAGATGGISDFDFRDLVVQRLEHLPTLRPGPLSLRRVELGPQIVEEQRSQAALDVLDARIVHPASMAGFGVQGALEHAAEDNARDLAPVEAARCVLDRVGDLLGHLGDDDGLVGEQAAIDVGESRNIVVCVFVALLVGRVDGLEQRGELAAQLARVALAEVAEGEMRLQQVGILGVEQEDDAGDKHVQRTLLLLIGVDMVVLLREGVVEARDVRTGLDG